MSELTEIITAHVKKYSEMDVRDAVKLIYQNEFGGGHLVADAEGSLARLRNELDSVSYDGREALFELIGNDLMRLNLKALRDGEFSPDTINSIFIQSSKETTGSVASFENKLKELCLLAESGTLPFSASSLSSYLSDYKRDGYPAVSHSERYRRLYSPAYRIISKHYAQFFPLFCAIDRALRSDNSVTVAIDGMCGSGKTTLASLLARIYDCNVVHMDDFFLPAELRTEARYAEPGGNVHYERFLSEVISGITSGGTYSYRVFDCAIMDYGESLTVDPKRLTVIEGSYSHHPLLRDYMNIKVFLKVTPKAQLERIIKREGPDALSMFEKRWIPLENRYFEAFGIEERSDLVFDLSQP